MRIGLHALGIGAGADREVIDAVASTAERCGFDRLWVGEHVIAVENPTSRYPYSPSGRIAVPAEAPWNDPLITLSFAAAATSRITLATGVLLLPEHNPVIIAKQTATLDRLSHGRLVLGVGLGWSREEFAALGVPFARRGERTEQYVEAIRALWRDDPASFDTEFARFEAVRMLPKPSNGASIPVVFGGNSDSALRRVAKWGDGWYGFNLEDGADVAERLGFLRSACHSVGRNADQLECSVALRHPDPSDVETLSGLGVSQLVVVDSPPPDPDEAGRWVTALADRWIR
jgi:probable F420-dependent oxidoreductase